MSIRISKIAKDFNVGVQTIIDSLQKKGIAVESGPNTKVSDEQYEALRVEFSNDKSLKIESDRISHERHNKEKNRASISIEPETPAALPADDKPRFKQVGKIDLDAIQKPKTKTVKKETPIAQPEQPVAPAAPIAQPVVKETVTPSEGTARKSEENMQEKNQDPKENNQELFRLNKPAATQTINVIGKIDLDKINQTTRPKKKSKEDKKKERDQKDNKAGANAQRKGPNGQTAGANKPGTAQGADNRPKRNRINKQKVDVNATGTANNRPGGQNRDAQGANTTPGANNNNNRNRNGQGNQANRNNNGPRPALRKPVIKKEVSEEDVQKQIKETLARLTSKKGAQKKGSKYRREKRDQVAGRMAAEMEAEAAESKVLKLTEFVTANDLANMMNVSINQIIGTCMSIGMMVSINQRLDAETINIVAEEFGFKTEYVSAEVADAISVEEDRDEDLMPRPPIVTVMGHVDHGKTSLLDYVRKANVIAGEAGGITQHIGAYNVKLSDGRQVAFLDTPGHEAFTAMRARGAKVTDIAIIIVAADDAVMPQTVEAINHASAAGVPIVFAINKVDKPHANPEKIKESLAAMNYLVEDWGGKYQSQDISAKQGLGVKELLEKVLLEAELLDLKANPNRRAIGSVIESTLDKGRGYVATVLVQNGTLRIGDVVLAGTHYGRVKAMFNERNQKVTEAGPAVPVQILGFGGAPQAGDQFHVMETEQEAREIANKREQLAREQGLRTQKILTLDDIGRRIAIGNFQELNVIVKGDVDGSVEALSDSLIKLSTPEIQVNVIHKAVGQISESDITLSAASNAIIIGFQVRPSLAARRLAEKEGVEVRLYSIIYDAIEEVKDAMEGMLAPEIKEEIVAYLEVRETFKITKVGTVAGCIVKEGKIKRNNKIRLIRDGIVIYAGELGSLKRFKEDVKEVGTNFECGLNIDKFNDMKVGDLIEAYEETEVKKKL